MRHLRRAAVAHCRECPPRAGRPGETGDVKHSTTFTPDTINTHTYIQHTLVMLSMSPLIAPRSRNTVNFEIALQVACIDKSIVNGTTSDVMGHSIID